MIWHLLRGFYQHNSGNQPSKQLITNGDSEGRRGEITKEKRIVSCFPKFNLMDTTVLESVGQSWQALKNTVWFQPQ